MLKSNFTLLLVLVLAAILRFYQLGQNPPSLDWDETAHGYNAYSILKTGRDEYGYKLPLYFRSFDDYKPPIYTYLVVPSVAAFGLNDFAVRFPSAMLGTLAVLFTYLMAYELFKRKDVALLSALFLAISPWHLQFSRVAFETNSATFWSVLGTWAFLKGVQVQKLKFAIWISLAAFAFGANLFMYHNARVFIPIFSLILIFLYRKELTRNLKFLVLPAAITLIYVAALVPILFSISGTLRYKGTTIFTDVTPQFEAADKIAQDTEAGQGTIGRILHNRRFAYVPILIDNYLSHFRPTYLFFTADMDRHHAPEVGLLYLWDLPFILAGIYFLLSKNFDFRTKIILSWWFLIAPVASSVTWGVPHSLRSEIYLPIYQIFSAIGALTLISFSKKKIVPVLIFTALALNFAFYLHQYYKHMPLEFSKAWMYGRKEAAQFTEQTKGSYERVIVSTKLEQPHEFWLYYLKYDPKVYQQEGGTASGGYLENRNKFDKYYFKPIDYEKQKQEQKTLFVSTELPGGAKPIKVINYLNGESAIYIFE